jgi:hypothetical protein
MPDESTSIDNPIKNYGYRESNEYFMLFSKSHYELSNFYQPFLDVKFEYGGGLATGSCLPLGIEMYPHTNFIIRRKDDEIASLKSVIHQMRSEIKNIKEKLVETPIKMNIIELREIPKNEAKQEILDYYQSHDTVFPSDVASDLGLDLKMTIQIVKELVHEGKLEEA